MRYAVLLLALSCTAEPAPCDIAGIDCCTADDECLDTYGAEAPFCVEPGAFSGYCGECSKGDHCAVDEWCKEGKCVPPECNTADC